MPGLSAESSPIKVILICILLLMVVLSPFENVYAASVCSDGSCGNVAVSPGKYSKTLGDGFPTFGAVKLSYPNGSILTSSVGDLLFSVNLPVAHYRSVDIYVPPDFTGLTISKVWSSFTNNYDPNSLSLSKLSSTDEIGPNWWKISVKNLNATSADIRVANRTFKARETQYVRIFQVISPSIAGRYFFKTFITFTNGTTTTMGARNFPTVVVKASRDPAYISGVLRDGGNASLAGQPILIPNGTGARILATGTDHLGRPVASQAFINDTAKGNYTLFGLAPGTYTLTAYAAGYVPTTRPTIVSVLAGQSLVAVDIYMKRSVNIIGTVWSIGGYGAPVPWSVNRSAIRIEVLTLNGTVAASTPTDYRPILGPTSFAFFLQYQVGFDGRIPQDNASYTSGLVAGDYLLRAYSTSYIQYDESRVHVGNDTTQVRSDLRLLLIGSFRVIVRFKDATSTLNETRVSENGTLTVQTFDQEGNLGGRKTTRVPANSYSANVNVTSPPGTYHIFTRFTASQGGDLFYQTEDLKATIGLGPTLVQVSLAMVRGGGINLTLYSVDAEKPAVPRSWAYPNATINLKIVDSFGNVYTTNATQLGGTNSSAQVFYAGLLTDDYSIIAETFGYSQREIIRVHVVMGGISDTSIWMVQSPRIDLTIVFKTEGLLSPIDSTLPFAQPINHLDSTPARVEIFDGYGNFVGASLTYVPNLNATVDITLAGFKRYFGNPRLTWSGFYDTTDATRQDEGGLPPGDYFIRIWVDGYHQLEPIPVTLPSRGNVSIIASMERASRISGMVLGPDLDDRALLLSWAVIDLELGDYTSFSLDGSYQLWVPSGSYNIGVSLPGYSTLTSRIEVPPGSDIRADFWIDNPQSPSAYIDPLL